MINHAVLAYRVATWSASGSAPAELLALVIITHCPRSLPARVASNPDRVRASVLTGTVRELLRRVLLLCAVAELATACRDMPVCVRCGIGLFADHQLYVSQLSSSFA